jgi:hypothetical protein
MVNMKSINVFWFVILTLIQTMCDSTYCKCVSVPGRVLLLTHHAVNIGFMFGSVLFGHHLPHLIILLGAVFMHVVLGGCFLTELNNSLCDTKGSVLYTFSNHILKRLHLSHMAYSTYYFLVLLVVIYDISCILRT